jgi:hypothetical protein
MDYQKAKDLRNKSFSDLMTDKLTGGQGIGSSLRETLSEKSKARMTGIKEKFDPMNIIKTLTFGSKLGPALYGKMMGRSEEDMKYFVGKKTRGPGQNKTSGQLDSQADSMAVDALGLIYRLMLRNQEDEKLRREEEKGSIEEKDSEEELRNQELVKALTARRKKEKPKKEKPTKEEPKPEPKKEPPKKSGKKEEAPKPNEKKPTTKEAPKSPEKVTTKEAPKAPEKVTPKEAPKAPTPSVKPSTAIKVGAGAAIVGAPLGALSSQFETGGAKNSGAIVGWDSTGGTSYGTYQIASKVGAMDSFLAFASSKGENDIVTRLKSAGPSNTGSKQGPFVDEWKKIAAEKGASFEKLQHDFIEESQYKPAVQTLLKSTGYDVEQQSPAIKDVFFSTVVQHGQGSVKYNNGAYGIFKKAIEDSGGPNADPKKIITNVYEIRRTKFGSSTAAVQASVNKRFDKESNLAIEMLNNSGSKIDTASKENKDLKQSLNMDKPKQSTVNNTTVTSENRETNTPATQLVDDRPAHLQKKG